jgi:hypothetical protein
MPNMRSHSRFDSRRASMTDPALTALLFIECFLSFIVAPCVSLGLPGSHLVLEATLLIFGSLVLLISQGRIATSTAVVGVLAILTGSVMSFLTPSRSTLWLSHIGSFSASIVVGYVVGRAVFAPGVVNVHRVRGAVVLYLNFAIIFLTAYRLLWDISPDVFAGLSGDLASWRASGSLLYFSFVTLTSVGFGDIVPVHPIARSLSNLEAIIGQLFPATLLARLITLQLEARRRA